MKHFLFGLLLILVFVPSLVFAINLNLSYPDFGGFNLADDQDLNEIVAFFYYFIVGISGLAAFVMLVWGGIQWLASGAIPSQASEARDRIRNAILGLLLILASFLIIQIINPELTVLGIGDPDLIPADLPIVGELSDGTTSAKLPRNNATKEGIYLCREKICTCRVVDNCIEGANPSSADYLFLDPDPAAVGVADPSNRTPGMPDLGSWKDEVKAVAVIGDYDVLLADDPNYEGVVICFDNRTGGNLKEYARLPSPPAPDKRWDDKGAMSAKILKGGTCKHPGVPMGAPLSDIGILEFWDLNVVFLFNDLNQGKEGMPGEPNFRRYKVSIVWSFRDHANPVLGLISPSLYVAPGEDAALLTQNPGGPGSLRMCFRESVDDLRDYSWTDSTDSNGIIDEINTLIGITDVECTEPGAAKSVI